MTPHSRALRTAALLMLLVSAPTNATIQLSFGLYTSNKPTSMVRQFRPVLDLMQAQLQEILNEPVEIRMQVAKDYSQGIEHLASGKVDFSRFGPASYIEAKRANEGLRILAVEREGGDKVFYGVIAVSKDSSITSVEQLRGKSFAFGNDQSTIGRYLSQQYLRHHGIFSADLSRFDYLGRHDTVGTSVGAGHFDAGALNESTFTKLVAKGVSIRELARFPNVTKPWIAREGLPERLFEALRESLLKLEDPLLQKSLKVDGFVPGNDDDFEDIRASIEKNSLFFQPGGALASANEKATESQKGSVSSGKPPATVNAPSTPGQFDDDKESSPSSDAISKQESPTAAAPSTADATESTATGAQQGPEPVAKEQPAVASTASNVENRNAQAAQSAGATETTPVISAVKGPEPVAKKQSVSANSAQSPQKRAIESPDSILTKEPSSVIGVAQEPAPVVSKGSGSADIKSVPRTAHDTAELQRTDMTGESAQGVEELKASVKVVTPVPARSESAKEPPTASPAETDSAGGHEKSTTPPTPPESTAFSAPTAASVNNEKSSSQDVDAATAAKKPETDKSVSTTPVAPAPQDSQSHPAAPAPDSGPLQSGQPTTADRLLEASAESANSTVITAPLHGRDGTSRLQ